MIEPKFCRQCGAEIVCPGSSPAQYKSRRYCSQRCAAISRNLAYGAGRADDPTEEEIWGPGGYAEQLRERQLETLRRKKS